MTNNDTDRTGHEKWLIYCPRITPDTLLHLSIQGTSYALRDYTGRLTSGRTPAAPASRSRHATTPETSSPQRQSSSGTSTSNGKSTSTTRASRSQRRTAGATSSPATTSGSASAHDAHADERARVRTRRIATDEPPTDLGSHPVSRWTGDASVSTTDFIYAHLHPSDLNEHIARFEAFVADGSV